MSNNRKSHYVTVSEDDGENYRVIAELMSELGYRMNHSTVHNNIVGIMRKFADALIQYTGADVDPDELSRSKEFQMCIANVLQKIESARKSANT